MNNDLSDSDTLIDLFHAQIDTNDILRVINTLKQSTAEYRPHYLSVSISIPAIDPLAVLEQNATKSDFQYYWEKPVDHFAIAAAGELERIKTTGSARFREASAAGKELLSRIYQYTPLNHHLASVHLLGGFSFSDHNVGKIWKSFGSGSFTLPEWAIVKQGDFHAMNVTLRIDDTSSTDVLYESVLKKLEDLNKMFERGKYEVPDNNVQDWRVQIPNTASDSFNQWKNSVSQAVEYIHEGRFDKIVLARELRIQLKKPVSDTQLVHILRKQYPDCYTFLIRHDRERSFIGSTPERLASFNKRFVLTEGLAGSISRGKTASEDAKLEYRLLHSKKDINEHNFVLDAIESNLKDFSDTVEHPTSPGIKKLSNVQHLYTPIKAKIKESASRTKILEKLHPTPAVGGHPRDKAMPYINKLEYFDRGWYAAPIGWINAHGEGEFAVAIRSGLIGNDEARFFAGCGIVADSDPEKEWDETNLKFIPMLTALENARNKSW